MWNRIGGDVVERLEQTYSAEVSSVRASSQSDRQAAIESAASGSADLVICVGPDFERSILTEAPRFPRTAFVLDRGLILSANVARVEFLHAGAAYLAGVTAAVLGGSTAGILEAGQGPLIDDIEAGFEQGFRSVYPWGGRLDRVSGTSGIEALAGQGIKIALYAAPEPDPELMTAAEESGVLLVTVGQHTLHEHSDIVVAAIVVDMAEAMSRIAADVVDDTFTGKVYAFDLGSGVVDLKLNPMLSRNRALEEALDQARAAVNAGMVEIEALGL